MSAIFDGSTTFLRRSSTLKDVADSKKGTLSVWVKPEAASGLVFLGGTGSTARVALSTGSGAFVMTLRNAANTIVWAATTTSTHADGEWHHLVATWDLGNTTAHLYVDRAVNQTDLIGPIDGTVDLEGSVEWLVGVNSGGASNFLDGKLHDLVFWPGVFLDVTDDDVLARLVSNDGRSTTRDDTDYLDHVPNNLKAVGYGPDASSPSRGVRPAVYFSGVWTVNRGTGGEFDLNGSFGTQSAPDQPNPYRLAAEFMTPGERWFDDEKSGLSAPRSETFIERRAGHPDFGKRMRTVDRDELTRDIEPMRRSFSRLIRPFPPNEEDTEDLRS